MIMLDPGIQMLATRLMCSLLLPTQPARPSAPPKQSTTTSPPAYPLQKSSSACPCTAVLLKTPTALAPPFSGIGQGTWEQGVYDYKKLPLDGCQVKTDDSITASWCYDPTKRVMVTYDTPDIIAKKSQFILGRGLGGGMWWESSSDKPGDASLISTVSVFCLFYSS